MNGNPNVDSGPPICVGCKHLRDMAKRQCDAFPAGIPWEILEGKSDHRKPFPGDQNIRFEPESASASAYADAVHGPLDGQ